ncbi:hypothetical protein D3C72_1985090 [compost metagenome]
MSLGGAITRPSRTTHTLDADASVSQPSRNWIASITPCSTACCAASTLPSSDVDLIWQFSQRRSSIVTHATPCSSICADGNAIGLVMISTVGTTSFGNACVRLATPRDTWM